MKRAARTIKDVTDATDRAKKAAATYTDATERLRTANGRFVAGAGAVRREISATERALKSAGNAFSSLERKVGRGIKWGAIGLGAAGIAGASAAAYGAYNVSKRGLGLAAEAEQANIAFTTMLGSAQKAQAFLAQLTDFANATPFELPQIRDASKRLLAFGFASKQILPMMTSLGNAAAGLGLGADGIDRLTLAIGQIKAKSKLQGDEALQLMEAGIPVWDILAKKLGTTTTKVMELSSKGLVPANFAINTLMDGLNERFPKMMDKQSKSLLGMYSTIKDTFNSKILTKWGQGIAEGITPPLRKLVDWIDKNGATIDKWGEKLRTTARTMTTKFVETVSSAFKKIKARYFDNPEFTKLDTIKAKIAFVFNDIMTAFNSWFDGGGNAKISAIGTKLTDTLAQSLKASAPLIEAATKLGVALGGGILTGILNNPDLLALLGGYAGFKTLTGKGASTGKGSPGPGKGVPTAVGGSTVAKYAKSPYAIAGVVAALGTGYLGSVWENAHKDPNSKYSSAVLTGGAPVSRMTSTVPPATAAQVDGLSNYLQQTYGAGAKTSGSLDSVLRLPDQTDGYLAHLPKVDERLQTLGTQIANKPAPQVNVNLYGTTIREQADVDLIAHKIAGIVAW